MTKEQQENMFLVPSGKIGEDAFDAIEEVAKLLLNPIVSEGLNSNEVMQASIALSLISHVDCNSDPDEEVLETLEYLASLLQENSESIYVSWSSEDLAFVPEVEYMLSLRKGNRDFRVVESPAWGPGRLDGEPCEDWDKLEDEYVLHINDHGNATFLFLPSGETSIEIWAVV